MSVHLDELERHLEDCEQSKMRHFDFSDICSLKMKRLSVINNVVMGLILAWVLSTQFKAVIPESFWLYEAFPIFIALLLAGLNAFEAKAGYDRDYDEHLWAAKKYHSLWRECKNWESDFSDATSEDFHAFVVGIRNRLNSINCDSPHITIFQQKEIEAFREKHGWKPRNTHEVDNRSD